MYPQFTNPVKYYFSESIYASHINSLVFFVCVTEHKNGSVSLSEEDEELVCKPDIAGRHNESFNQKASNGNYSLSTLLFSLPLSCRYMYVLQYIILPVQ